MKHATLLLLFLAWCSAVMAQEETVVLKPGESLQDFKVKYVYRFPGFVQSKIINRDGSIVQGKMNYNHLSQKIEFIGPANDTLSLIENPNYKMVILDKSVFVAGDVFYELLRENEALKLATRRPLRLVGQRKVGAMGLSRAGIGMDSYASVLDFSGLRKITPNVEHVFSFSPAYYIAGPDNKFIPASVKSFQKLVPGKADAITSYVKNNHVSFSKLEDVSGLFSYLEGSK